MSLLDSPLLSPLRSLCQTPVPKGPDIEEGFDISPPLTANDMERYAAFLHAIRSEYSNDPNVRDDPSFQGIGGIVFDVAGEHPWVPLDGRRFLRFSATLHGPTSEPHTPEEDEIEGEGDEKKGDEVEVEVAELTEVAVA
ncbi:hypothetical protein CspHIS471_0204600 [Cutaneotrichosporon sp. HIS471]|nr:hypothetical protein CspHIS471_0204600 [Cutaneotrichosporon sp. HIS471]